MTDQKRRELKPGELFAIDPKYLQQTERGAFFWIFGSAIQDNEMHGDVAVVHVRDVLDHHEGWGDSYDALVKRIQSALDGDKACRDWDMMAEWYGADRLTEKKGARPDPTPAKTIVLCIDSPGGVVSGLNQTVEKIRRMCAEKKVPLIAYANEKACSAAYALACACEAIYAPPSAIIGSIGVRSMMCDQTQADKKAGLRYVLIASGERKLDGDPHMPIADAAVSEEEKRVDYLANQFFSLVGTARGKRLPAEKAKALQANVLIGKKAKNAGLIDDVIGWDALLAKLQADASGTPGTQKPVEKTGTSGIADTSGTSRHNSGEDMRLTKKIAAVKAEIKATTDAKKKEKLERKLATLRADDAVLAAAEAVKKTRYKHETEEEVTEDDGDAPEEEDAEDDPDAEDDEKPDAEDEDADDEKPDAADDDEDADAEGDDEDPDAADDDEKPDAEDEASDEEAIAALTSHLKGKAKQAATGRLSALFSKARSYDSLQPQVQQLRATEETRKRTGLIEDALRARRITKKHAKDLRGKPLAFVKDFLAMHQKPLYFTADDAPLTGEGGPEAGGRQVQMPEVVRNVIEQAALASSPDAKKQAEYREAATARWLKTQNGAVTH